MNRRLVQMFGSVVGSTGENCFEGDYLTNAQGEDVVAWIRITMKKLNFRISFPGMHIVVFIAL